MESNSRKFISNFQAEIIEDFSEQPKNPLLTIRCSTYNHEEFITEAINGFLMQKTDFPFEILIHDDASTDGTAQIVRTYQGRHPNLIRVILQSENQFSQGKRPRQLLHALSRGKYIALCEGDDYWTDPLKLQKQVDFLETHLECNICTHNVLVNYSNQIKNDKYFHKHETIMVFSKSHYYVSNFTPTCSIVFRNLCLDEYYKSLPPLKIGDWPLFTYIAQFGSIAYLPDVMSVYRIHNAGLWSSLEKKTQLEINIDVLKYFNNSKLIETNKVLRNSLLKAYIRLGNYWINEGNKEQVTKILINSLPLIIHASFPSLKNILSLFLRNYIPCFYTSE